MSTRKVLGKNAERLKEKHVVIVGIGGIGCNACQILARLGICLTIVDNDIVDDTNLERQLLYDKDDLLKKKVYAARDKLSKFAKINPIDEELDEKNIKRIITKDVDLVIDCTDNSKSRIIINRHCMKQGINWIYSAAILSIGAVYFIDNKQNRPCYECIQQSKNGETSCEVGVLSSLVVLVAAITSNIAINYLAAEKIEDRLLRINMNDNTVTKIGVKKYNKCICNNTWKMT